MRLIKYEPILTNLCRIKNNNYEINPNYLFPVTGKTS